MHVAGACGIIGKYFTRSSPRHSEHGGKKMNNDVRLAILYILSYQLYSNNEDIPKNV